MARAYVVHPNCIDEHCSIKGKDVKESLHEIEPSWLGDLKVMAVFVAAIATLVAINLALNVDMNIDMSEFLLP